MEQININLENLTDKEREALMELIKKGNEPLKSFPQIGDTYYYVDSWGEVQFVTYNKGFTHHSYRINMNNYFKTKKEAEEYKEKLLTRAMWKRMAEESWVDSRDKYKKNIYKYFAHWEIVTESIFISSNNLALSESSYFSSPESAKEAMKTIGEEKVKKYILEVE